MSPIAVSSYAFAVVVLFAKAVATALVQGRYRLEHGKFRWPEDARHWGGEAVHAEADIVQRAQRVLLNDAETQPLFLALGAAYVALDAWPPGAPIYFGVYALSRVAHTIFLLRPRQPLRNRAFAVGMVVVLAIAIHVCFAGATLLAA